MSITRLNQTLDDGTPADVGDINPISAKVDECVDQINLKTEEIETARGGAASLNERINSLEDSAAASASALF